MLSSTPSSPRSLSFLYTVDKVCVFFPCSLEMNEICDGELTAAIKRGGFSYLTALRPLGCLSSPVQIDRCQLLWGVCANMLTCWAMVNIEIEIAVANHHWQNCEIAISQSQVDCASSKSWLNCLSCSPILFLISVGSSCLDKACVCLTSVHQCVWSSPDSSTWCFSPVTTLSGNEWFCHTVWHSTPINHIEGPLMQSLCILRVSSWHPLLPLKKWLIQKYK